ncbi:MAG: DUF3348 domain-containing protein [Ramlibacter sp.]
MRSASDITSPKLVRRLGAWVPVPRDGSDTDVAQRLGQWLNAFDAVGLQAAHQAMGTIRGVAARTCLTSPQAVADDLQRVRSTLAHAIAQDPVSFAIPTLVRNAAGATSALPVVADSGYAPYQQRHLKLQRQMEQSVAPLRDRVRQVLSQACVRLRQLAALDAVLEQVMAPREQAHLPTIVTLLQRRFEQLRLDHRQGAQAGAAAGWRDVFRAEWTQTLLAELDLRLEPVAGMVDALANE